MERTLEMVKILIFHTSGYYLFNWFVMIKF